MNHTMVIDGNSLAHASHNSTKLTAGPMQVQAIFGVLKSIRHLLEQTPGKVKPLVLWDGRPQFRYDLFPEYKANREAKTPEEVADKAAFKTQMPILEKMLELLGVTQMRSPLLEADDLSAHIVPVLARTGRVTMVTGDQDWLQMVSENATWFDPIRNRKVTLATFYEETGFKDVNAFAQGKCLIGDTGDNVAGVPDIGKGTAPVFMAQHTCVYSFFEKVDAGLYVPAQRKSKTAKTPHPEQFLASPEGRALFERNMKLMALSRARRPEPGEVVIVNKPANTAMFEAMCKRLMFASILREMDTFLAQFGISRPPPWEAAA